MRPDQDIAGCLAAAARLHATIEDLGDGDVRRDSLLPGWTVGHVLTHLARNADSHVRMIDAATRGEVGLQYAAGQREQEIEAGAGRPAAALVADVRSSSAELGAAWAAVPDGLWERGEGRSNAGTFTLAQHVVRRWREVELHHADLGLGFTFADLSPEYVARELAGASPPPFGGRTDWQG